MHLNPYLLTPDEILGQLTIKSCSSPDLISEVHTMLQF